MKRRDIILGGAAAALAAPAWSQQSTPAYEGMTFDSHGKTIRAIHYRPPGEGREAAIGLAGGTDVYTPRTPRRSLQPAH